MASLSLKHIYKVYDGGVKAVNDFCMEIEDKEFIVFVGPSGCGKSTTLRMIAGLEDITAGELRINDEIVNDYEPKDRDIAMVFQNYALYPHMTVYENMAFALRTAHMPNDQIHEKVLEAAEILGITQYLERKPKALSGGQRQRVALGRAIVRDPKVFLLDEPLSNLDAKLRASMRAEISRLHNRLQTTFIYVTHDQVEAMTMGTRIVVMKDGFVQQIDTPQNLYKYPANLFVAGFIGTPQMNFFDGTVLKEGEQVRFALECGQTLDVPYQMVHKLQTQYLDGKRPVVVGIRPDDVRLDGPECAVDEWAKCKAVVSMVEALGGETLIYANLNTQTPDASLGAVVIKADADCEVARGDVVDVAIHMRKLHVFDKETEISIKPRLPESNTLLCDVTEDALTLAGQTFALPPALQGRNGSGCMVAIPSAAITLGEGAGSAKLADQEQIDGKTLYRLEMDGLTLFAISQGESKWETGAQVRFDIDLSRISVPDCGIQPPARNNVLPASFVKIKEQTEQGKKGYNFYLQVGKQEMSSPAQISRKLFAIKDTKIFHTPLELLFDAADAQVLPDHCTDRSALNGTVEEILDYGKQRFARIDVAGWKILALWDGKPGEQVSVRIRSEGLNVKDRKLDILII